MLRHTRWSVHKAHSVNEARAMLEQADIQVVLCQKELRDGAWLAILEAAQQCRRPPSVVVLSRPDEREWADVLNLGAYDLLPIPCRPAELYAIVPEAWRHCMGREQNPRNDARERQAGPGVC
jgi:DNA-binding NtrC family response regulator